MKDGRRAGEFLKIVFVIIGAAVSVAAIAAVAYTLFKKYFQVTFDCDSAEDNGEDDYFADEEDKDFEPICCCEEDEEEDPVCCCEETPVAEE